MDINSNKIVLTVNLIIKKKPSNNKSCWFICTKKLLHHLNGEKERHAQDRLL